MKDDKIVDAFRSLERCIESLVYAIDPEVDKVIDGDLTERQKEVRESLHRARSEMSRALDLARDAIRG